MATNIEIKARVMDLEDLRRRVEAVAGPPAALLNQEDVFFPSPKGRLKLRTEATDNGQLIYYERADTAGPKASYYLLARTPDPGALRDVLAAAWGISGIVRKRRWLYWVGQTRVHLDAVEGLGSFMELEVVLRSGQSEAEGQAIAAELMDRLGIEQAALLDGAYLDLLSGGGGSPGGQDDRLHGEAAD